MPGDYIAMISEHILRLGHALAEHRGLKLSTISTYIAGSGDTLERLRRGRTMTIRRGEALLQKLSDRWPADLPWPPDIPRPPPNSKEAA